MNLESQISSLRSEALFEAAEEDPQNPQVKATLATGLRQCRILHTRTPNDVLQSDPEIQPCGVWCRYVIWTDHITGLMYIKFKLLLISDFRLQSVTDYQTVKSSVQISKRPRGTIQFCPGISRTATTSSTSVVPSVLWSWSAEWGLLTMQLGWMNVSRSCSLPILQCSVVRSVQGS